MKGIVFTPEMNAARRDGRKSMTRRKKSLGQRPPYKVGDVLYVREKHRVLVWGPLQATKVEYSDGETRWFHLLSDDQTKVNARKRNGSWLPGRYMLASFARDHIRITGIRSERLRAITEADAVAEGVEVGAYGLKKDYSSGSFEFISAVDSFRSLWQSIHGQESWALNPEVWVIEFENCEKPTAV